MSAQFSIVRPLTFSITLGLLGSSCKTIPGEPPLEGAPLTPVSGAISDEEAARLALINNAAFRELSMDLGIAEAELIQAKELPNPGMSVLFPLGPKQLEYAAKFPVEALWLRPKKAAVAKANIEAVGERLVQDGLDLIRDTKVACADLRLAERKVELAREDAVLVKRFADVANARLDAGEISELEVSTARADALQARITRDRSPVEVKLAHEKLRHLLGVSNQSADFTLTKAVDLKRVKQSETTLLQRALTARPDLRAAELMIEAEGKRLGLAQADLFKVTAVFDSNGDGSNFEAGPGLDLVLPIFNQNQGAKALADAKFKKALQRYVVVRDLIALEVRQSFARYQQAERDAHSIRYELLPALNETIQQTEKAWEGGEVEYLFVLESNRRRQAARLSEAEAYAEWQRSLAELERAIGSSSSRVSGKALVKQ